MPVHYLDNAAHAHLRPQAWEAMSSYLRAPMGNPSGAHVAARRALDALEEAREALAAVAGVSPGEVVFTSGGTEADNAAIFGAVRAGHGIPACSAAEHHAVLEPTRAAGGEILGVDRNGAVDLEALGAALEGPVGIVSVMAVNNEVGTVSDLAAVAALIAQRNPSVLLHSDAVQAGVCEDVAEICARASLVSLSAHKVGGPVGIGALVIKEGVELAPLLLGGPQERARRAGTQDVASALGMAAAFMAAAEARPAEFERLSALRDALAEGILSTVPDAVETVERSVAAPTHCHVLLPGAQAEEVLYLLDEAGVCASGGSSCASGASEPSHVLSAMGIEASLSRCAIRFSFGWDSGEAEVARVLEVLGPIVEKVRR